MAKEVKLPSGATLKITLSPFAVAKGLWQALLKELRGVPIQSEGEMADLYKNLFTAGFSSPEVDKWLTACLTRCTYDIGKGELKIDETTFEDENTRQDYVDVCAEVAKENVGPFVKGLYARYLSLLPKKPTTQQ